MNDIIGNNTMETWVNHIISNYKQVLLVLMVFLIIYSVEYMSHINTLLYGMLAMPSIPGVTNSSQVSTKKNPKKKK